MISWFLGFAAGVYVTGFIFTVLVNPWWASPITFGLSMLRAALWPIWLTTGWPEGERQRM